MSAVNKRKQVRFHPDDNQTAWLSLDINTFSKDYVCLIDQESYDGCKLILNRKVPIEAGDCCLVKVGAILPILAEVRWLKELPGNILTIGLEFKE